MVVALAFVLSACGVPIFHVAHGYTLEIVNGTDVPLVVHERNDADPRFSTRHIEPGDLYPATWNVPVDREDNRKAQIDATDADGNLLFCERYSYEDVVVRLKQRVVIVRGHIACNPPSPPP